MTEEVLNEMPKVLKRLERKVFGYKTYYDWPSEEEMKEIVEYAIENSISQRILSNILEVPVETLKNHLKQYPEIGWKRANIVHSYDVEDIIKEIETTKITLKEYCIRKGYDNKKYQAIRRTLLRVGYSLRKNTRGEGKKFFTVDVPESIGEIFAEYCYSKGPTPHEYLRDHIIEIVRGVKEDAG